MSAAFDEATHTYTYSGRVVPGVSEIIKDGGLSEDFDRIDPWYQERGKAVHRACHLADIGRLDVDGCGETLKPYIREFLDARQRERFTGIAWELMLVDHAKKQAGTLDMLALFEGHNGMYVDILDFKSGGLPKTVGLQLAAYKDLLKSTSTHLINKENFPDSLLLSKIRSGKVTVRCKSIHLPGDGLYKMRSFDEPKWDAWWISLRNLYNMKRELGIAKEKTNGGS